MVHAKAKMELDQIIGMLINYVKQLAIEEHQLKASGNALISQSDYFNHGHLLYFNSELFHLFSALTSNQIHSYQM